MVGLCGIWMDAHSSGADVLGKCEGCSAHFKCEHHPTGYFFVTDPAPESVAVCALFRPSRPIHFDEASAVAGSQFFFFAKRNGTMFGTTLKWLVMFGQPITAETSGGGRSWRGFFSSAGDTLMVSLIAVAHANYSRPAAWLRRWEPSAGGRGPSRCKDTDVESWEHVLCDAWVTWSRHPR